MVDVKVELELPLTLQQCADMSPYSLDTIRRRVRDGHLRAYKPPGCLQQVVNPVDFRHWLYGTPVEREDAEPAVNGLPTPTPQREAAGSLARLRAIEGKKRTG